MGPWPQTMRESSPFEGFFTAYFKKNSAALSLHANFNSETNKKHKLDFKWIFWVKENQNLFSIVEIVLRNKFVNITCVVNDAVLNYY